MIIIPGWLRRSLALYLLATGLLVCALQTGTAYAIDDKGRVVVDHDNFRERLAKDVFYLEDVDGKATLDQVREAAARGGFSRFRENTLQFGYSKSTYWIKFSVENRLTQRVGENLPDRFFLSVRYPLLDDVRFYTVHENPFGTRINEQTLGDLRPYSERIFNVSDLIFPFTLAQGERADVFLKVSSESSLSIPVYLEPERAFVASRFNIELLDGIYLGISIGLCLYNFFLWLSLRERSYFIYVVFVAFYLIFNATMAGHTFRFWPEAIEFQQTAIYFFSIFSGFWVIFFGMTFLQTGIYLPRYNWVLRFFLGFCALGSIATFFVNAHVAAKLNMVVAAFGVIILVVAAVIRVMHGYRPAIYYLVGQGSVLFSVIFTVLTSRDIIPYYYLAPDVLKWCGAFELLFFSIGLADRINVLKSQQDKLNSEAQIAKAEARARQVYINQLDQMNGDLEQAVKTRSEFLANMSHEIRTPMNGVLGMLELVDDASLNATQKQQLEIARRSGKTLLALVNDILDLSKIEAGKLELEILPFNVHDFLEDLQQLYGKQLQDRQLTLTLRLDPAIPLWIEGDRTRLWQVLTNLVSNAIKFTHQGGITVKMSEEKSDEKDVVRVDVCDTGIGIPAEAQHRIFESFSQADGSTTRKYGGTGLGLTISLNLVKLMGGVITVDSEVGKGSVFSFSFPLRRAEEQSPQAVTADNPQAVHLLSQLRVLLVEDNAVNRQVATGMLKKLGVTEICVAEDGAQAVDLIQRLTVDLILMDVQMPVMDGYEATRMIRTLNDAAKAQVPIVALTANANSDERKRCEDCGMDDFLTKPMQKDALREVLCRFAEKILLEVVVPIRRNAG